MILYPKNENREIWAYLIALFLTAGIVFGIDFHFSGQRAVENLVKNFQAEFKIKEGTVEDELLELMYFNSKTKGQIERKTNTGNFYKTGIANFIYQNDSLVFWSTNTIPGLNHLKSIDTLPDRSAVKLLNGWYFLSKRKNQNVTYVVLALLQRSYPFNNEYLQNDFQKDFKLPKGSEISDTSSKNIIFSKNGKPLFSLQIPDKRELSLNLQGIYFGLFIVTFFLLIYILYILFKKLKLFQRKAAFSLFAFFIVVLLVRLFFLYFRIPGTLYSTEFFIPLNYASSQFVPSLGDFFLNASVLLIICFVFYKHLSLVLKNITKTLSSFIVIIVGNLCVLAGVFVIVFYSFRSIIINSSFSLDLQNIANLDILSILGLFIVLMLILSLVLALLIIGEISRALFLAKSNEGIEIERTKISLTRLILLITACSVFASVFLNYFNDQKEKEKRGLFALKLGVDRDPVAELLFCSREQEMLKDSIFLIDWKIVNEDELFLEDKISSAIRQKYFQSKWTNYSIQITLCYGEKKLRIQPYNTVSDCEEYFQKLIKNSGKPTASPNLFFLDFGFGYKNYLAVIPLKDLNNGLVKGMAYIEISSKLVFKDLGYPGLLIDNRYGQIKDFSIYSYAFYRNHRLTQRFGEYNYDLEFDKHHNFDVCNPHFFSQGGFNHYCFPIKGKDFLLVSIAEPSLMDRLAPFSYLFLFFSLNSFLFFLMYRIRKNFQLAFSRMGDKIQFVMTTIIFISLFLVGGIVVQYIIKLNQRKNDENLNEKTYSVLVEFQHKYGSQDVFSDQNKLNLTDQLTKLSNVYFTDINLFSQTGKLIASSRPEVFSTGLLSDMMNPVAFNQIRDGLKSFYLNEEIIGNHRFHSAYIPFYNDRGDLLAFINLPSFARQEDIKKEIASFLVNFINAYAVIIILGILVSLLVSFYITKPLKILTIKISSLTFGRKNEKIVWRKKDEIGRLVDEYNRMVEELEKSADLLIKSERESAWREMAKQVAHEIKNPLTPMKLSVQQLERLWQENIPEGELYLKRFTRTMIEQIDTLSSIATEFEMFAKMPQSQKEILNFDEIIKTTLGLYANIPSIQYQASEQAAKTQIFADKKQLFRVLTNLINNSVQAIENTPEGCISILMDYENHGVCIKIVDNGIGISESQKHQIFIPNFTTKTTGKGLGLAIVKNIIEELDGQISFYSDIGKGTTFTIWIPEFQYHQNTHQ